MVEAHIRRYYTRTPMHTYAHLHIHTRAGTNTHTNTRIHMDTHTHTYTHTHADTHPPTHPHTHIHTRENTRICTRTHTQACTHTRMCKCPQRVCVCVCIHKSTHILLCIQTDLHPYSNALVGARGYLHKCARACIYVCARIQFLYGACVHLHVLVHLKLAGTVCNH